MKWFDLFGLIVCGILVLVCFALAAWHSHYEQWTAATFYMLKTFWWYMLGSIMAKKRE